MGNRIVNSSYVYPQGSHLQATLIFYLSFFSLQGHNRLQMFASKSKKQLCDLSQVT